MKARDVIGCLALWAALADPTAHGAEVTLVPVADTSLVEAAPDNNLGGLSFCNAGTAGTSGARNRALVRFAPGRFIPPGAIVRSVQLSFEVTGVPSGGGVASVFRVHRGLVPWGEGNKAPVDLPGLGLPAEQGEATWNHRFAGTTNTWSTPGAAAGVDYLADPSADVTVYGIDASPYVLGSTPGLVADVQHWVDAPDADAGWFLICASEETPRTARRFGSREDPIAAPTLSVSFESPLRLRAALRHGSELELRVAVEAGWVCGLERAEALPGEWLFWTNLPAAASTGDVIVVDQVAAGRRFYRAVRTAH